ncbi:C4-dicarboxylate transporter/malic acid transport family protein, partial [Vibrio parahaemolyticus V-223/04]
HHHQ